jgi:hypothetical protein
MIEPLFIVTMARVSDVSMNTIADMVVSTAKGCPHFGSFTALDKDNKYQKEADY